MMHGPINIRFTYVPINKLKGSRMSTRNVIIGTVNQLITDYSQTNLPRGGFTVTR